jgi:hypothetical protein
LAIEEISVGEIALDVHDLYIIPREFESFERRCNRLTRLSIEELVPTEG